MKTVVGFLENLDFNKAADMAKGLSLSNPKWAEEMMSKQVSEALTKQGVVYDGPFSNMYFPRGGYFFKLRQPEAVEDLRPFVLGNLGLNDNMRLRLNGANYIMRFGVLVKKCANDGNPEAVSIEDPAVLDLGSHVFAFNVQRQNPYGSYFIEVDEVFAKRYPIENFRL